MPKTKSHKNRKHPKKEVVKFIVNEILQKKKISTQRELAKSVNEKLKAGNKKYVVSAKRVRKIALEEPNIRVYVHTKHGKTPGRCPCCGAKLKKRYSRNLYGRKRLFGLSCNRCNYEGKENRFLPRRYDFAYVK